jgi:hypothetical protein
MNDFWNNFLANLFSDLIVGAFLGSLLAWWIGKRLSTFEQKQHRKEERREKLEKATHYAKILKRDVTNLYQGLNQWIPQLEKSKEGFEPITSEEIPRIDTRFWDVVQRSGEIPSLLSPNIVYSLTLFYGGLTDARQCMDWAIEGWKMGESHSAAMARIRKFGRLTLEALKRANLEGDNLIKQMDTEIQTLNAELIKIHE